jgi:hypothetical protein
VRLSAIQAHLVCDNHTSETLLAVSLRQGILSSEVPESKIGLSLTECGEVDALVTPDSITVTPRTGLRRRISRRGRSPGTED